jgi:uncharacterized membrane protein HdeD (DUF308 family)
MNRNSTLRERYFLAVSVIYVLLGLVILVRSATAHVLPVGLLGLVFVGLGAVRLRDYFAHAGRTERMK